MMPIRSLYICYFGVREPLVQTQVIPYLRCLAADDVRISLLTFEPEKIAAGEADTLRAALAADGIAWSSLPYHKRPSAIATAWDIFRGTLFIRKFIARERPDILHGRVHVPALMAALARKFSRHKPRLLFDIRGFFPEEYVDAGVWTADGMLYRAAKRVERWLMRESDGFVVLTEKARRMVFDEDAIVPRSELRTPHFVEVIPCCVDLDARFSTSDADRRLAARQRLGVEGRTVYAHVGALGGLYLTRELADMLAAARELDPRTFALFLTQSKPDEIVAALTERGFSPKDYFVGRVAPAEIPEYLAAADAGLSFVKAGYATRSRSPTKIPEYLAAGLPLIANRGVGDVDELIETEKVGIVVERFDREAYLETVTRLRRLGSVSERCRAAARERFDLRSVGGRRYLRLYKNLLQS